MNEAEFIIRTANEFANELESEVNKVLLNSLDSEKKGLADIRKLFSKKFISAKIAEYKEAIEWKKNFLVPYLEKLYFARMHGLKKLLFLDEESWYTTSFPTKSKWCAFAEFIDDGEALKSFIEQNITPKEENAMASSSSGYRFSELMQWEEFVNKGWELALPSLMDGKIFFSSLWWYISHENRYAHLPYHINGKKPQHIDLRYETCPINSLDGYYEYVEIDATFESLMKQYMNSYRHLTAPDLSKMVQIFEGEIPFIEFLNVSEEFLDFVRENSFPYRDELKVVALLKKMEPALESEATLRLFINSEMTLETIARIEAGIIKEEYKSV